MINFDSIKMHGTNVKICQACSRIGCRWRHLGIRGKEQEALHDEERHDMFPSPDISSVAKARRMGWVGHVALLGRSKCWWANLQLRDHSEDRRTCEDHMKAGTKNKFQCYIV